MPDEAIPIFSLTLEPDGLQLPAPADRSLLASVLSAGVTTLASSCRAGHCRRCRVRLTAGQVAYTVDWPGLSADERRDGWVLPCVARPRSDVTLRRDPSVSDF